MSRLFVILILVYFSVQVSAADSMSPRMAQRVLTILDRAEQDPGQALASLKELLESRAPNSSDRGYILYERAALLVQQEQTELAIEEISAALVGRDDDYVPRLRFLLGQLYLMSNEPRLALQQLNTWLRFAQSPRPAELAVVAYTNLQMDNFEDAATVLERAIATADEPQSQWFELLAFSYTRLNRGDEALALVERVITLEPTNARWWRQLASIYLLLEDVPKGAAGLAVSALVEEIEFNDAIHLAKLFNILGMPADGAQVLEIAFKVDSDSVGFEERMLLAELWMLAREFGFAVREFELAATLDMGGEANWRLGQLYMQRERYTEAGQALAVSISEYAEDVPPQLYYLMAIVAINLENYDTARAALSHIEDDATYGDRAEQLNSYIH